MHPRQPRAGSGNSRGADPDQMLRSRDHIASEAPYVVYRFRPEGIAGIPGQ